MLADGPVWQDSLELRASLWQAPDWRECFHKVRGYDCTKYLPLYFVKSDVYNKIDSTYRTEYVIGDYNTDGSMRKAHNVRDYEAALTESYVDSLKWFADWAESNGFHPTG